MNLKAKNFVKVSTSKAEIFIYDFIGPMGEDSNWLVEYSAKDFIKQLADVEKSGFQEVDVHINSGGGYIAEGYAIFNAIKNSKLNITGFNDGIALSIAGYILMACDKVVMAENSLIM